MATRQLLAELTQAWQARSGQSVALESVGGVDAASGMAVATGRPPAFVAELASRFQARQDLGGVEDAMWRRMLESEDKVMRELAARKLQGSPRIS
jgi:hypothetical protein